MLEKYTIKYNHRKTMGLYITKDAKIEVRVPKGTSKNVIEKFVKDHENWIEKYYHPVKIKALEREEFKLNFGDKLLVLGKKIPLLPIKEKEIRFDGKAFYAYENLSSGELLKSVVSIYRDFGKEVLVKRTKRISEHMNLKPNAVKITGAKTRWGSYSEKGNINFSWYLVMAKEPTIDYVIVHELAHLIELNHSQRFWDIVQGVLPEYQKEKENLKKLQQILTTQNWE